jgi:hypothetical protein
MGEAANDITSESSFTESLSQKLRTIPFRGKKSSWIQGWIQVMTARIAGG